MNLLSRLVIAVVVGVLVTLACVLLGSVLMDLRVAIASTIGEFLKSYGSVLGVLAALYEFFTSRVSDRVV